MQGLRRDRSSALGLFWLEPCPFWLFRNLRLNGDHSSTGRLLLLLGKTRRSILAASRQQDQQKTEHHHHHRHGQITNVLGLNDTHFEDELLERRFGKV